MSLHIEMEQTGDVTVLQCVGRMMNAEALGLVKDAVTRLSPLRVIVLDLSEVEMLDAGGLGMLVSLRNWACANDIQLKLVNPSKLVREALELTGLTSVLHVSSVEDVIEIFCGSDRAIENITRAVA
jgi:anti-sigma B factor antagonist